MNGQLKTVCAWCKAIIKEGPAEPVSHGICQKCEEKEMERMDRLEKKIKAVAVALLLSLSTVGCRTVQKLTGGVAPDPVQKENPVYSQLLTGNAAGPSTQTLKADFAPVVVTTFYAQSPNCAPIGEQSLVDVLPAQDPSRHWPYAVETVVGNTVTVYFGGMEANQPYCWAVKSSPRVSGSSRDLY